VDLSPKLADPECLFSWIVPKQLYAKPTHQSGRLAIIITLSIYGGVVLLSTLYDLVERYRRDVKKVKMSKVQRQLRYEEQQRKLMNDLIEANMYEDLFYARATEGGDSLNSDSDDLYKENEAFKITEWQKVSHDIQFSINRSSKRSRENPVVVKRKSSVRRRKRRRKHLEDTFEDGDTTSQGGSVEEDDEDMQSNRASQYSQMNSSQLSEVKL